jgi:dUTP pyrophosphatase
MVFFNNSCGSSEWVSPNMAELLAVKLNPQAKLPTVAHPGWDLCYDIYALEDVSLLPGQQKVVKTGIAAAFVSEDPDARYGLEIEDRSGLASQYGVTVLAGKIDAGYTGEIGVVMLAVGRTYKIRAGEKIAQMQARKVMTDAPVRELNNVSELPTSERGANGYGSTGKI